MSASIVNYTHCLFCNSDAIHPIMAAKDYTVSNTAFEIWHCDTCTNRFTQSVPDIHHIGAYYQSAAYISHSDTAKGLINKLYHWVRGYTLGRKKRLIQKVSGLNHGALLDIGAGTGAFVTTMLQAGWTVTGLEPDSIARENAKQKHGIELRSADDIYSLPQSSFNVITLWHVLEHVHDLHGYFRQFVALLKPGGKLVIAVPNYTSKDASAYGAQWAAWDVPRHLYHFSPKGMEQLAKQHGFNLESIHPMWFDAFYVSMLSEQYKNGKPNLPGALLSGISSNLTALGDKRRCSSLIYVFNLI
nr:class I SAM-dependent methyltransferase [uncultured Sediminibacterium sp.]